MPRPHSIAKFHRALELGVTLTLCAAGAQAGGTPIPHGSLELVVENQSIAAGHDFYLGLHFQLEKSWHIDVLAYILLEILHNSPFCSAGRRIRAIER